MKPISAPRSPGIERRASSGQVTEYLAFRAGGELYALPVTLVREIVRTSPITRVPRAPGWVKGITSFRGQVVTVIDLGVRLGASTRMSSPALLEASSTLPGSSSTPRDGETAESPRSKSRILITNHGGETLGLLVDEVDMVHRFAVRDVELAPASVGSDVAVHVAGIARPEGRQDVVLILDPQAVLP